MALLRGTPAIPSLRALPGAPLCLVPPLAALHTMPSLPEHVRRHRRDEQYTGPQMSVHVALRIAKLGS